MRTGISRGGSWAMLAICGLAATVIGGCGGSDNTEGAASGSGGLVTNTRARIQALQRLAFNAASNGPSSGGPGSALATVKSLLDKSKNRGVTSGATRTSSQTRLHSLGRISMKWQPHRTREDPPNFFFDEDLQLWDFQESNSPVFADTFFEDHEKTKPAGSLIYTLPENDGQTFPQRFSYTYSFTAGPAAGVHGAFVSLINEDGSGQQTFDSATPDGYKESGSNKWQANELRGVTLIVQDRTDLPDGTFTSETATWVADANQNTTGTIHVESSEGITVDYTQDLQGMITGRITGNVPGLPATFTRDDRGTITTTYADGTVEVQPGEEGYVAGTPMLPNVNQP